MFPVEYENDPVGSSVICSLEQHLPVVFTVQANNSSSASPAFIPSRLSASPPLCDLPLSHPYRLDS